MTTFWVFFLLFYIFMMWFSWHVPGLNKGYWEIVTVTQAHGSAGFWIFWALTIFWPIGTPIVWGLAWFADRK